VRLGYDFGLLELSGGVENLFDEAYRIHGSGVDGVGRAAWIALHISPD
jgi:hypothetical protein